jgi:hypothetical protein
VTMHASKQGGFFDKVIFSTTESLKNQSKIIFLNDGVYKCLTREYIRFVLVCRSGLCQFHSFERPFIEIPESQCRDVEVSVRDCTGFDGY